FALTPPPPLEPTPPPVSAPTPPPHGAPPPGLPRPTGSYAPLSARVPAPPAPAVPAPALYDPSGGFPSFPPPAQPLDFGQPVVEMPRRAGPPGLLVLFVLLAAAAGGAKLAQLVTRADVAKLEADDASTAAPAPGATARENQ
ncbi:MAG: hypothetical protein ABUS79_07535, partial [Pseudomonadota bacterium]